MSELELPFKITVYDKHRQLKGWITNPLAVTLTPRHNAQAAGEVHLRATDPILEFVLASGARFTAEYLVHGDEFLFSGRFRGRQGDLAASGTTIVQMQGDWRKLSTPAWVRPGGAVRPSTLVAGGEDNWGQAWLPGGFSDAGPNGTVGGQYGYYLWPDGSAAAGGVLVRYAEDAIKHIIEANLVGRLGEPVTVAPRLGRGGDALAAGVLPRVRNVPLSEVVLPLLEWSGLGLTIGQLPGESQISVEVYEPKDWASPLSVEAGTVRKGTWSLADPEVTRVLVGGPGEEVSRAFFSVVDAAREAEYGEVLEVFKDATGWTLNWGSLAESVQHPKYYHLRTEISSALRNQFTGYLQGAGTTTLNEGAPKAGVAAELSETESFHFGGPTGFHLGDRVTIEAAGAPVPLEERIRECVLSFTVSDGLNVTPTIGEKKDDPDRNLARAIVTLAAAQRRIASTR